jgi:hypothetical protein
MNIASHIERWPLERLTPYDRNARTHSPEQVAKLAASIAEFGFVNPILVDRRTGTIIAGHGRLMAAQQLGLAEAPVIVLDHLSDAQRRAYVLADNRLAEDAGWNVEILARELSDLQAEHADLLGKIGFNDEELAAYLGDDFFGDRPAFEEADGEGEQEGGGYSRKIVAPTYTPKRPEPPATETLVDMARVKALEERIRVAKVTEAEREFLMRAAQRHALFDYQEIAEYYAHASAEMQRLMEDSALVIVDFERAIERGYIELSQKMMGIYAATYKRGEIDAIEDGEGIEDDAA